MSVPSSLQPPDRATVEFPSTAGYRSVGRLVLGGVAARFELPIDRVDDLLLAVDSLLLQEPIGDSVRLRGRGDAVGPAGPPRLVPAGAAGRSRRCGASCRASSTRPRSAPTAVPRRSSSSSPPRTAATEHDRRGPGRRLRRSDRGVPRGRREGPRGARRALHAPRAKSRVTVRRPRRAAGGPRPGRVDRTAPRDPALRHRAPASSSRRTRCRPSSARSSAISATAPGRSTCRAGSRSSASGSRERSRPRRPSSAARRRSRSSPRRPAPAEDEVVEALADLGGLLDPVALPAARP